MDPKIPGHRPETEGDPRQMPQPLFARRIDCGAAPRPGAGAPPSGRGSGQHRAPGEEAA